MNRFFLLSILWIYTTGLLAQQATSMIYPFAYQGEWGLINENLEVVLKPSLDSILLFETRGDKDHTIAMKDGQQGLLNQRGKWVFKPKYDNVMTSQYYVNHLRWVLQDGLYGLITTVKKKAKWVFKPQFTNVQDFYGRKLAVAIVSTPEGTGAINAEGKIIADFIYDEVAFVDEFKEYPDLFLKKGQEVFYIDTWGTPLDDNAIEALEEELVFEDMAIEDGDVAMDTDHDARVNYVPAGEERSWKITVEDYNYRSRGYEVIKELVIAPYDRIIHIELEGGGFIERIQVERDGKQGFLDEEGKVITPVIYDQLERFTINYHGGYYLHKDGHIGLAYPNGRQVLPADFSKIEYIPGLIKVHHKDNYVGYASRDGKIFLPIYSGE